MIRIDGRGAVYGELWYDEALPRDSGVDIVLYRQRGTPVADARSTPFLSLVTDLSPAEDAIFAEFGKDCRYKVKRAEARDGLELEFLLGPHARLDAFRTFYDAFARQKGLPPCDRRWLRAACEARQLALAAALRDGEVLVWHAYVLNAKAARLQHSASSFRERENDFRALVGRANRWLHWQEMLRFKQMGLRSYDWGGLFEDESVAENAGVNRFKRDFGGREVRSYDCTAPATLRGRVWLGLRAARAALERRPKAAAAA